MKHASFFLFLFTISSSYSADPFKLNTTIKCIGNTHGYLHVVFNEKNIVETRTRSIVVKITPQETELIEHEKDLSFNDITITKVELITLEGEAVPVTLHNIANQKLKALNTLDTGTNTAKQETHIYLNKTYPAAG